MYRPIQVVLKLKIRRFAIWLGYLSTRRTVSASSTRNELPVRQRASPARHGLRAGYAAHSCSACCRLVPACASSLRANTLGQLRPWAGRGSGKTSRHCERLSVLITKSRCKRINSAETGAAVEPPYTGSKPSLQIGQPSASWAECDGPIAWPSTPSCKHLDAWWSLTDASRDSHPPGNCTAWPHPGSRCNPSPAQTVVA